MSDLKRRALPRILGFVNGSAFLVGLVLTSAGLIRLFSAFPLGEASSLTLRDQDLPPGPLVNLSWLGLGAAIALGGTALLFASRWLSRRLEAHREAF
ncbi:hypothetical protein AB0M36_24700 [Actinoplanes sp. NPDC051346]|uniref:hypothetical protein n=1 Tax=Actinoplanes sp. NPDC051346 TaxID=3155048 RepID=UPI00342BE67D